MRVRLLSIIVAFFNVGCVTTSDGITVPYYHSSPMQKLNGCPNISGSYKYTTNPSPGPSSHRDLMQTWFIGALIDSSNSDVNLAEYYQLVTAGSTFQLTIIGDTQTEFFVKIQQGNSERTLVHLKESRVKGDYSCANGMLHFREKTFSGSGDGHENLDYSGSTKLALAIAEDKTLIGYIREVSTKRMSVFGLKEINEGWPAYEKVR